MIYGMAGGVCSVQFPFLMLLVPANEMQERMVQTGEALHKASTVSLSKASNNALV